MNEAKSSKKRWWLWTILLILIVIFLFLLAIPSILSSDAGTRYLTQMVERKTGGRLSVQDLSLGWFSEQKIDQLSFTDKEGGTVQFDKLTSSVPFWNLIFRSGSIGTTRIEKPAITIPPDTQVKTPTQKEKKEKAKKKKKAFWNDLNGHLIITDGSIQMLSGIELDVTMPKLGKISSLSLEGKSTGGSFSTSGKLDHHFVGTGTLQNFPVEVLDYFISQFKPQYKGLIVAAFGNTLNGSFSSTDKGKVSLSVRSPRLFIDLFPTYENNAFVFADGGRIVWTIKPEVFNHFSEDLLLQSNTQSELEIRSAKVNLDQLTSLAMVGTLTLSDGIFLVKKINERLSLQNFTSEISTEKFEEQVSLSLNGTLSNASLKGSFTLHNPLEKDRSFPQIDLNIDDLPLSLIDSLMKNSYSKYLGKSFSGKIQKSDKQISLSGKTPLFQFSPTKLVLNDEAKLTSPATFEYLVEPTLYEGLSSPFPINGTLKELTIPLDGQTLRFIDTNFDLTLRAVAIQLKDLLSVGNASLPELRANLIGSSFGEIRFNGTSPLIFGSNTLGQSLFGQSVTLNADGTLKATDDFAITPLNINLEGSKFKGTITAAIEHHLFILKKALSASLLLEPDQINPILAKNPEYPLLTKPTPLNIEIKPSQIPLKGADLSSLSIQGKGTIDALSMINPANRYPFDFQKVELDFDLDGKKKAHTVRFEGNALEENAPAGKLELLLQGNGNATDLVSNPSHVKASLSSFSSQIADVFFKTRGQLPDMIGETLSLNYEMEKTGDQQAIDLNLKSPHLTMDGSFLAGKDLELRSPRKPLKIHWDLSEKAYDAYRRWRGAGKALTSNNSLFTIMGTGKLNLNVSPLSIPLKNQGESFPKPDLNLYGSRFEANMRINDLKLEEGGSGAVTELKNFDFDITKPSIGNAPLTFKFNGNVSPEGKVQGAGKLEDFLSPAGTFDASNVTTEIHAQIQNLPSVFVDALSKLDANSTFPPSAFLGDHFNGNFDAEIKQSQGKITMNIDASACKALFNGFLSNGTLYLKEPLKAVFTVTPQLNDVLEKGADLVVVAIEKPITLYIHDEGFNVPLKNLHIRNMNFNYGQLDLGQIIVRNTGSAEDVSSLFKMDDRGNKSIWFAPSIFNMKGGKMYVDRTEILYNHAYQVCLWGKVNFPSKKVDMTLGLTAQALRAALGIQGIDDDYVLKVPVRGPFGNVKVDKGAGASKIAFLLARKHLAPQTGIFGQVLGAVGDLADNQSDVPPPKPPFPWQGG